MFLLAPVALFVLEVFVFIEVGQAIGWLWAVALLIGTSLVGAQLLRIQGRAALARVSTAVSERRAPGRAALDGALGFAGALLLVVPGFVTDAAGVLLLFPPTRILARRSLGRHYGGRIMRVVASTGRFAPRGGAARPADVDSTAVDVDQDQLGR
ncbi:MAG: FxsA family protein [Solirubrobacteraceae bacterium]|jgi:UPF0716 protein FxsA